MIQVCSRCGTRWNVRDRQRHWCPRCHGALLAPSTEPPSVWSAPGHDHRVVVPPSGHRSAPSLPPGYRWIAVRPGSGPRPRRRRRPLGPTPRYSVIPRWGLIDPALYGPAAPEPAPRTGPSPWALRATLITTIAVLAAAAALHLVRYALLIVNRSTLLHPLLAWVVTWLGVLASVGAFVSVIGAAVALTGWLIGRRAAAFDHRGQPDPRPRWALWAGCLVPLVNWVWAPVFVIELAVAEGRFSRLRARIVVWWVAFVLSTVVSVFATATAFRAQFFTQSAQAIADNTVSFIIAYLMATAAVIAAAKVVLGFEYVPVERPAHRWLIVAPETAGDSASAGESGAESAVTVEPEREEPAA